MEWRKARIENTRASLHGVLNNARPIHSIPWTEPPDPEWLNKGISLLGDTVELFESLKVEVEIVNVRSAFRKMAGMSLKFVKLRTLELHWSNSGKRPIGARTYRLRRQVPELHMIAVRGPLDLTFPHINNGWSAAKLQLLWSTA